MKSADLFALADHDAVVAAVDVWLDGLYDTAGGQRSGMALVAVGGYGRREMSPGSDLDLLLLHRGVRDVAGIADRIWYPIWDSGIRLDHAVRTPAETRRTAADDIKAALGLLDSRCVAGDHELVAETRSQVLGDWRAMAATRLSELRESVDQRRASKGDLAHLLEPDIKESYGGLRETTVLRAITASWVTDVPRTDDLASAQRLLMDVRDALHRQARRQLDVLLLQEQSSVAQRLGYPDDDALLRAVLMAGRTIAHSSDVAWHRVGRVTRQRPARRVLGRRVTRLAAARRPLAEGVVVHDDEVVLAIDADPSSDPVLVLRAAASAAQAGLLLAPVTVDRLGAESARMPVPWPGEARDALVSLLGAGRPALPVWESLDQAGVWSALIPEWEVVRSAPQRNAVHRFTVDRHLVEAAIEASPLTRRVDRPDLLLVGALLHDIGKARGGDHTEAGILLAGPIAEHLGFSEADAGVIVELVRHHLLLPQAATGRDLDDPATAIAVAEAVGSHEMLDLLHALTIADAAATGPAAWSDWKAGLVDELVARAHAALAAPYTQPRREGPSLADSVSDTAMATAESGGIGLMLEPSTVTFVTEDRSGLLAAISGVLALHRLHVRSADTESTRGPLGRDVAVTRLGVLPMYGDMPAPEVLREDLRRVLGGSLDVDEALRHRESAYARSHAEARVIVHEGASDRACVIEVRAHDSAGLLHRLASAITGAGGFVIAARVSTLGSEAVDVFYVVDEGGRPLGSDQSAAVCAALAAAAGG